MNFRARIAFLENQDSFSYNVIDALPFSRDQIQLFTTPPADFSDFDAVVVGPGPRDPWRVGLVDCIRIVAQAKIPLLGICLGHQAFGLAFGAELVRNEPAHGKRSLCRFEKSRFFPSFQGPHTVMRYHSLSLRTVQSPLRVIASLEDGTVMAMEHATLPMASLQFHPDSHATPQGPQYFTDFFSNALETHL
jgi:anthranilate synthase/aminodeoxychorismate synthase-like glutamine amidotransferase